MVYKKPKYDLRILHTVLAETGLIIALLCLIGIIHLPISQNEPTFLLPEVIEGPPLVLPPAIKDIPVLVPPPPVPDVPIQIPNDSPIIAPEMEFEELDLATILEIPPLDEEIKIELDYEQLSKIDVLPKMIGGEEALKSFIEYPKYALLRGIQGIVEVEFYINKKGEVIDPVIVKGIGGGCDEEVLKAIQEQRYRPGIKDGKIAAFKIKQTVQFIIIDLN